MVDIEELRKEVDDLIDNSIIHEERLNLLEYDQKEKLENAKKFVSSLIAFYTFNDKERVVQALCFLDHLKSLKEILD